MYHYESHIGERFHQLTIKSFYKTHINTRMTGMYICTCQCNPEKEVHKKAYEVIRGITISCGCLKGSNGTKYDYDSEIGKTYGHLKILEYKRGVNGFLLLCECKCNSLPKWFDAYSIFKGKTKSCGCLTKMNERQEMVGKKFGKLKVLGHQVNFRPSGQPYVQLLCKCDCGKTKYVDKHAVKGGQLSCGCMVSEQLSKRGNENRKEAIYQNLYKKKIIGISKKKKMNYDITFQQFIGLINQPCYYCGETGSNTHYDNKKRNGEYISVTVLKCNGIDRLNPKIGYVRNNVVPCCRFCNTAKMTMELQEFQSYIIKLYNHFLVKKSAKIDLISE